MSSKPAVSAAPGQWKRAKVTVLAEADPNFCKKIKVFRSDLRNLKLRNAKTYIRYVASFFGDASACASKYFYKIYYIINVFLF